MNPHDLPNVDDVSPSDHSVRNTVLALGVLCLAGATAWYFNDRNATERKAHELQRAANAWSDLSRCLSGEHPRIGTIARTSRRIELKISERLRAAPRRERINQWPWRCATHANTLTRALFASRADDAGLRLLNQFASRAATDLESASLHTGHGDTRSYLDELFAAAERSGLPQGRTSNVALPPTPMVVLEPSRVRHVFAGSGSAVLAAEEVVDGGSLRVVLGRTHRRLCDFERTLEAPLCTMLVPLDNADRLVLTTATYPRLPGVIRADAQGVGALMHPGHLDAPPLNLRATGAHRIAQDDWVIATEVTPQNYALVRGRNTLAAPTLPGAVVGVPKLAGNIWMAFVASVTQPVVPDGGVALKEVRVIAGTVSTTDTSLRWGSTPTSRGTVNISANEATVRGCRFENSTAMVVYGDDGRAHVQWWTGDTLTATHTVDARVGSVSCSNQRMKLTWYWPTPMPTIHVSTCSATGCAHAEGPAPFTDVAPRVVSMGERVLLVYTSETYGGLRYRYGSLATVADEPETVIFDDAAHDGIDLEAAPVVLSRGDLALILVTRKTATAETWAFRIDGDGYRTLRLSE
jgi:hypothetical protein